MDCPISDCPLKRAVKTKQRENMEIELDDGRWVLISVDPIKHENSNGLFVHIVRDITEIKNREIEILNAHKAEAFSILSGGIAHDYNNLLSVIWGNISLLREDITDALQQEFIEEAEKACEQARTLTHKFITLSKGAMFKKRAHPIEDILRAITEKLENKNKVTISLNIQDRIPPIEVDPDYLMIAFENIIQNGLDAMAGRGQLEIQAGIESLVSEDQKRPKYFKIFFKDTGKGILKSDVIRVFDPYFTTKEMGTQKGSGLGLAVSESIIKKHGGNIRIESMLSQGTTVIVSLPLPDFQLNDLSESNIVPAIEKPIILFMDDDPSVNKMCERMLQRLNCIVITASCSREAVKKYLDAVQNNVNIDLILLDQNIIGGIGGIETLKELRKNGYDKKAIVITGSPSSPAILDFEKYGFDGKLLKPYSIKELKEAIGQFVSI